MLPNEVPLKASQYPISPFNNIPFPHLRKSKISHNQNLNIISITNHVRCIIRIPLKKSMFTPPSNLV